MDDSLSNLLGESLKRVEHLESSSSRRQPSQIQLHVKLMSGELIHIVCSPSDKIFNVKLSIEETIRVPRQLQQLLLRDAFDDDQQTQLSDDFTVSSAHLKHGDTLSLMIQTPKINQLITALNMEPEPEHAQFWLNQFSSLELSFVKLSDFADELVEGLRCNESITSLKLSRISSCPSAISDVLNATVEMRSLIKLELSDLKISSDLVDPLVDLLKSNASLRSLVVQSCEFVGVALHSNESLSSSWTLLMEALSHNQSLTEFVFTKNNVDDTALLQLAASLQVNRSLTRLDLMRISMRGDDGGFKKRHAESWSTLMEAVGRHPVMQTFIIAGNDVGKLPGMVKMLRSSSSLTALDIRYCAVDAATLALVEEALSGNSRLQSIDLSTSSVLTDDSIASLLTKLLLHPRFVVSSIAMAECNVATASGLVLASALQANSSLTAVNFSDNHIDNSTMIEIARSLAKHPSIVDFQIGLSQGLQGEGFFTELSAALRTNTSLKSINLSKCQIDESKAVAMCSGLAVNSSLVHLDLSTNQIGIRGSEALSAALLMHSQLTHLDLRNCFNVASGDDVLQKLAPGLRASQSLQMLDLADNRIGDEGIMSLCSWLQHHSDLIQINLGFNQIGDDGAVALGNLLSQVEAVPSLEKLYLDDNQIGCKGAIALAAGVAKHNALRWLNLTSNQIDDDGVSALAALLEAHHPTLQKLALRINQFHEHGSLELLRACELSSRDFHESVESRF